MEDHNLMEDADPLSLTHDEKSLATLAHLAPFVGIVLPGMGNILVPLLIWLFKRNESEFIGEQAKEALNFQITMSILLCAAGIACIFLVGIIVLPVLIILDIVLSISAAVKANRGDFYEYPLNFRLIK